MNKTAVLDFIIKSNDGKQFSAEYSEFDIDAKEKENRTSKEAENGSVAIKGSYAEQYSFLDIFRQINSNGQKPLRYPAMERRSSMM